MLNNNSMKYLLITFFLSIGLISFKPNSETGLNQDKGLHSSWNVLLQKYVSEDGIVDYSSWNKNKDALNKYIKLLEQKSPAKYWDRNDSLAYFINAYNAITVKLILDNYPLESIKEIKDPWDSASLKLFARPLVESFSSRVTLNEGHMTPPSSFLQVPLLLHISIAP